MTRNLVFGVCCLGIASLFLAAAAAIAQPTSMLEEFQFGEDSVVARLLFFEQQGEDGPQLCAAVGTRRGPRSINRNHIFVTRRVRPDEQKASGRLKFKFSKKPDAMLNELQVWHSCVEAEPAAEGAEEDVLEVTVRGGQEDNTHSRFYTPFPTKDGAGTGVQIQFNNVGGLAGGFFEKKLNGEDPYDLSLDLPAADAG